MIPREHKDFLVKAAKTGYLPKNCVCPARCKFCYQRDFTKIFPRVKTKHIPQYTKETFDFFYKNFMNYQKNEKTKGCEKWIQKSEEGWKYLPECDFFNLGLTQNQIEKAIQIQGVCYTTGLNADPKFIKYLSQKYPKQFRLHLSIVTFNPSIRKSVMSPDIDIGNLEKIYKTTIHSTYFLLCFNKEQVISDIDILNKYSLRNKGAFFIHKLYHNKFSPNLVKDYAVRGENDFKDVIYYLKLNDKKLNNISNRLSIVPAARVYAWVFRREIGQLLKGCHEADSAAIFCSAGAYQMIHNMKKKINVIPVENSMGGCMDFTLGMTIRLIMHKIREMLAKNMVLREIYLPGSMFAVGKRVDINGEGIDLIKEEFPGIKVKVIDVPLKIINRALSLNACFKYYIFNEVGLSNQSQR